MVRATEEEGDVLSVSAASPQITFAVGGMARIPILGKRCFQQRLHAVHSPGQVLLDFMTPDADHLPPLPAEAPEVVSVAMAIPFDLFLPVIGEFVLP